jgi:hypothetical protein
MFAMSLHRRRLLIGQLEELFPVTRPTVYHAVRADA